MTEWEIYPRVAAAVGIRAIQQNVAREVKNYFELAENAKSLIEKTRSQLRSIA